MTIYQSMFVALLREALAKFNSTNIEAVTVISLGMKDFLVFCYVRSLPTLNDKQVMDNAKSKIMADSCKCADQLNYHWQQTYGDNLPSLTDGEIIVYDRNARLSENSYTPETLGIADFRINHKCSNAISLV